MGYNLFSRRGSCQEVSESLDLILFLHSQAAFLTLGWNRGEHGTRDDMTTRSCGSVFRSVSLFFFFSFQNSYQGFVISYLLSPFRFVVLESLELLGLIHTVPSFAFINNLLCINYLEHDTLGFPTHSLLLNGKLKGQV